MEITVITGLSLEGLKFIISRDVEEPSWLINYHNNTTAL